MQEGSPIQSSTAIKMTIVIYSLYLASIVLPPLAIVGVILAYVFENDAAEFLASHYRYLIRSFWIAMLYFSIASLTMFIAIGILLLPICAIWWLIRSAKGLNDLLKKRPIAYPTTWLF